MNEDMDLIDSLRRLAAIEPREAGPQVEERLLAALEARRPRRLPSWVYAAAACLAVALAMMLFYRKQPAPTVYAYDAPGFVALPYAQSGVPLESVVVIRVQMRSSELSSMGLAVPATTPTARVTADLLVGQDGVARAVRLVE